jgi:hypothetical protein
MRLNRYYPDHQSDQVSWLANFCNKLPGYATALGLTTAQVAAAVADCGWLRYVLGAWLPELRSFNKAGTDAGIELQTGQGSAVQTLPTFSVPAPPAGVSAVTPGALDRIFALVKIIKASGKCTDIIGTDLGILARQQSAPDLTQVQPVISAKVSGSEVDIKWGWQGQRAWLGSCQIMVDRGDSKGFELLCVDTTPNYVDSQPFPAARTIWTYKAIYRAGDVEVGRWSQPVSVNVGT